MIGKSKVRGVSGSGVERRPDEWKEDRMSGYAYLDLSALG